MNIVSAVANLEKERDYYRDQVKEAQAVIKQLAEGVKAGEVEYIHPWDLYELMDKIHVSVQVISLHKNQDHTDIIELEDKKYKQSVLIPAKTKNFR